MDPQFEELAGAIADAVEKRLSGAFEQRIKTHIDEFEQRADQHIKTHIDQFEQRADQRTKTHIDQFEQRADQSIKTHIDQFEQRAELRMQMHFENLETKVTLAAEGYGATLQKIERELADLNKKVDTKLSDHDLVLADHNRRITELKKRR